jgi:hypothetical protein
VFVTTEDFKGPPPVDFDASELTAVLDEVKVPWPGCATVG